MTDDARDGFKPHLEALTYRPRGRLGVSFDLLVEKGAQPQFETRDVEAYCLARGPTLGVGPDGWFHGADGGRIAPVAYGEWMHVELECGLGRARAEDVYTLRLTRAGASAPQTFGGLRVHAEFRSLGWMGWLSLSRDGERYFIDNFRLTPGGRQEEGGHGERH